jgi:hypothetical protein
MLVRIGLGSTCGGGHGNAWRGEGGVGGGGDQHLLKTQRSANWQLANDATQLQVKLPNFKTI